MVAAGTTERGLGEPPVRREGSREPVRGGPPYTTLDRAALLSAVTHLARRRVSPGRERHACPSRPVPSPSYRSGGRPPRWLGPAELPYPPIAMTVSDWMTPEPVAVAPDAGLIEIRALFKRNGFRHVPVVKDGSLVGVVSDRDVLRALSPFLDTASESDRDVDTLATTAESLMTPAPLRIRTGTPLSEAVRHMIEAGVSSLLVVDEAGALVGILTASDVLRASARV